MATEYNVRELRILRYCGPETTSKNPLDRVKYNFSILNYDSNLTLSRDEVKQLIKILKESLKLN